MDAKIKIIDVYGSFDNKGEMHHYTYCTSDYSLDSGWTQHVSDLRTELAPRAGFYYCSWCTKEGWWISKVIPNPHDSRKDPVMLSVCIGKCRPKHGSKAVALLDSFVDFFIIQKIWDDKETEKKLLCDDQELELFACDVNESAMPALTPNSAYRTYESQDELFNYLSFLPQPGYEKYSRIFFVPKENSNGMPIECIDETIPLRRIYTLHYPDDCSSPSGKTEIMEGENLILVYTKSGLEPFEKVIKGGETSDFAYVEGDTMIIRSGKEIGLVHNRVVEIICKDEWGNRIDGFTLDNYTRQNKEITISGKKVILPEKITQEAIVRVEPNDNQYEPVKVTLTDETENPKVLTLEPKKYKVVFRMNDRTFETIETMNPSEVNAKWADYDSDIDEYAGIVYFRAHRIKNDSKHQFVNGDKDLPFGKRVTNFFKDWWLHLLIMMLTLILICYGIYAAISLFRNGEKPWPFETKTEEPYTPNEAETGEAIPLVPEESVEEETKIDSVALFQQDVEYLKKNDEWRRDSIQTKEFQGLYDVIASGKTNDVVKSYNALFSEGVEVNGFLKKIVEGLIKIDQLKEGKAVDALKNNSKVGCINLSNMLKDINSIVAEQSSNEMQQHRTGAAPSANTNTTNKDPRKQD